MNKTRPVPKSVPNIPKEDIPHSRLDPIIHEPARLMIVSVLNECERVGFNFLLGTTQLTRGNLSVHMARLVQAGYAAEKKAFVDRKPQTHYWLTPKGRETYDQYRKAWKDMTTPN